MTEFAFEPPLRLVGTPEVIIRSLDEAAIFMRGYKGARRPMVQDSVLHRLEGADTTLQQRDAASAFRGWAVFERVLIKP